MFSAQPQLEEDPATKGVFNKTKPLSSTKGHDTNKGDNSSGGLPPVPPSNGSSSGGSNTCMTSSGSIRSIAEASAVRIVRAKETKYGGTENEEQVISINLSRIAANPQSLPDSVKLQTDGTYKRGYTV